ncbi:hypothetical protein MKEN_00463900 [Mycena kentingensis (nom. inval.)]|nr:hypothetical protein MKEN_00463900 [Mycena kentingensis (nom. inval.)]
MGGALSTQYTPSWQQECAALFNCTSPGLVDVNGNLTSCPADSTNLTIAAHPEIWGITYTVCEQFCGMDKIVQRVDFSGATLPLTTWLLPWIALTAQLPFETGGWHDLLSACMCIGSPALATYSLALTQFNRGYVEKRFKQLKERASRETNARAYGYMRKRIKAAEYILQECQQCPMRVSQRAGELSSLVVRREWGVYWARAAKDLSNTSRGFTYSFLAQVLFAFFSYLISFIAAVHDSLGSPDVGLQFASSSLWSWMFPIVFGYIRVGSQYKAGAIKEALVDNNALRRPPPVPPSPRAAAGHYEDDDREDRLMPQRALRPDAELYLPLTSDGLPPVSQSGIPCKPSRPRRLFSAVNSPSGSGSSPPIAGTSLGDSVLDDDDDAENMEHKLALLRPERAPTWAGIDVRGDERREGPIFNYARALTWWAFADHVTSAFEGAITEFSHRTLAASRRPRAGKGEIPHPPLQIPGTRQEAADACGLPLSKNLRAFPRWSEIPASVLRNMLWAALLALFLQFGTTGAAVFVAYQTPAIGVGCRSGSYLIYGVGAIVSWLLLVASGFLSHAVLRRLEADPGEDSDIRRAFGIRVLSALAVLTRLLGKTLAVANAAWLVASSVLEEIGSFQTCWCQTDAIQYGHSGWTPVFKGSADLRNAASGVWIGGFLWSITVCAVTAVIFAFGHH